MGPCSEYLIEWPFILVVLPSRSGQAGATSARFSSSLSWRFLSGLSLVCTGRTGYIHSREIKSVAGSFLRAVPAFVPSIGRFFDTESNLALFPAPVIQLELSRSFGPFVLNSFLYANFFVLFIAVVKIVMIDIAFPTSRSYGYSWSTLLTLRC